MVLRSWLAGAILLAAALCARAAGAEILIGVAGPMTGAYAWFGEQYQRGTDSRSRISTPLVACSVSRFG